MSPLQLSDSIFPLRRIITFIGGTLLLSIIILYSLFQARFLLIGPRVTLSEQLPVAQTQRQVTLTGVAENITFLSLNGREIYTDKDGYFKEALVLENGYTVATLSAQDRYGRIKTYEQSFVYTPAVANITH